MIQSVRVTKNDIDVQEVLMANNDDYGYFGKGSSGYAHYTQMFNQCFRENRTMTSGGTGVHKPHASSTSSGAQEDAILAILGFIIGAHL
jgi:hypothetical protein